MSLPQTEDALDHLKIDWVKNEWIFTKMLLHIDGGDGLGLFSDFVSAIDYNKDEVVDWLKSQFGRSVKKKFLQTLAGYAGQVAVFMKGYLGLTEKMPFFLDMHNADAIVGFSVFQEGGQLKGANLYNGPDQPATPDGPTHLQLNESGTYTSSATHPDGSEVRLIFYWGDGHIEYSDFVTSGTPVQMSHVYATTGVYPLMVKAACAYGANQSVSAASPCVTVFVRNGANQSPSPSGPPSGQTNVQLGQNCLYTARASDPDGDDIQYKFMLGDVEMSWSNPVPSNKPMTYGRTWSTQGMYNVLVKVRDAEGAESDWSQALQVAVAMSNSAPNTPGEPTGPTSGTVGLQYDYVAGTTDPEGDDIRYIFDWADGICDTTQYIGSGVTIRCYKTWWSASTYGVKVKAEDSKGGGSDWSAAHYVSITNSGGNNPPNTPSTPGGPSSGLVGQSYTFSSSATDPDGDQVAIRYDWGDGTQSDWSSYVSGGTTVSASHSWGSANTYQVKAQAKDDKGAESNWSSGAQIVISVQASWHQALASAPWHERSGHGCVTFNDRLLVFGGVYSYVSTEYYNDVWSSADGTNWGCLTPAASWSKRCDFGVTVHNGNIWVMGGHGAGNLRNDVWRSPDGSNWTQVTADCPCPREEMGLLSYGGKLWVFGGDNGSLPTRDVWYSTDGASWTQATVGAPWHRRQGHATVVFDNKMWILGGDTDSSFVFLSDVWSSTDGVVWSQVTGAAPWGPRAYHRAVVYNGRIWVIGGYNRDDAWSSADGVNWTQETSDAPWDLRPWAGVTVMSNRIWLMGGWKGGPMDGHHVNDVWYWP